MDYARDTKVNTQPPQPEIREAGQGGPIVVTDAGDAGTPPQRKRVRRLLAGTRWERYGFWIIVVAALAVLLLAMGLILPPVLGGLVSAFYTGVFVGGLTLMNLTKPSQWANTVLGRRVFPVLKVSDGEVWRLAGVNAALVSVFAFAFYVVSYFLGPFIAGIIVIGALVALGIFYNRARKVIINP